MLKIYLFGNLRALEDMATRLAADENGLPVFLVRPFVRKALARMTRDGSLARITARNSADR